MKLHYGWVVVAAGALLGCVAMGSTFSLAVFLQPMSEATGWSRTGVSLAMTLVFINMGVGGFFWGALTDRYGPRIVVLAGAVLMFLATADWRQPLRVVRTLVVPAVAVALAFGTIYYFEHYQHYL